MRGPAGVVIGIGIAGWGCPPDATAVGVGDQTRKHTAGNSHGHRSSGNS